MGKKGNIDKLESKGKRLEALINLSKEIREKENRQSITFNNFLGDISDNPYKNLRNIFQLFYDMVHTYIPNGYDEFPQSPDSIGFVSYDCSQMFVDNCDSPFFADRLFANRLMKLTESFIQGVQHNHIYLFEGPPGSGKSTFLNILLQKLEEYTGSNEGAMYETVWKIDIDKIKSKSGLFDSFKTEDNPNSVRTNYIEIPCPSHDHPIIQIPKSFREKFLNTLIENQSVKEVVFNKKSYEWLLKSVPCTICKSIFETLLDCLKDPLEVFEMIWVRRILFNRQLGEGITVYNPGDSILNKSFRQQETMNRLSELISSNSIEIIYSDLAKTNNGVYALMDIKDNNIERLMDLHGIISDGIHKVELIEEQIKTLFLGLVNPEDKKHYENVKSFQDRIITVNIPYVLDYYTEVEIYKNKFGEEISGWFLPGVLNDFARIIVSTRMETETPVFKKWIINPSRYKKYLDDDLILLKMEMYTGKVPDWLSDEDLKRFDRSIRRELLEFSESEGKKGISGRQSLNIFGSFVSQYARPERLITMEMVKDFFMNINDGVASLISEEFLNSIGYLYDYNVLQQVKESIYHFNEKQISRDILNYLFAINFEPGSVEICNYTNDPLEIDEDFFKNFEFGVLGNASSIIEREDFRSEAHYEYITSTLSKEINTENKKITETTQYLNLFKRYTQSLKENSLAPFSENENFRHAVLDFNTEAFKKYDDRLKKDITRLIKNLVTKFNYNEIGARDVTIYVIDNKLNRRY